jgi:glycosyltransferase involved in cell wall biosynthesis
MSGNGASPGVTCDVLIPTYRRAGEALAVTLAGLVGQAHRRFRVVLADQNPEPVRDHPAVAPVLRALRARDVEVAVVRNPQRRGMAHQRHVLLEHATAPRVLFLDDDILIEGDVLERLERVLVAEGCGFVGCPPIGPSFLDDVRPEEQLVEPWEGPVRPERIRPGDPAWQRWRINSAANVWHAGRRLGATAERPLRIKVAWVYGCVLFDAVKLRAAGGFGFWAHLPPNHRGEDILAQLRVMERFGGCGVLPTAAYHLEHPTTLADRRADALDLLA